jgi:probable F420-dependent oxidoreductase
VPIAFGEGGPGMPGWATIRSFARAAEDGGLDSVWLCDHLFSDPRRPAGGIHEGWTILAALAASTTHLELGHLVLSVPFRNPALVAKMAATADAVSGGRLLLGLGAGWADEEGEAFGYPTDCRVARLEEALQIVAPLLHGESITLEGRFYSVREAVLDPAPERRIPVLVAGGGPRIFRLTARFADAWNTAWYGFPDDRLRGQMARLDSALAAEGREPSGMRRTVGVFVFEQDSAGARGESEGFRGSVEELAGLLEAYADLGVDDIIVGLHPRDESSLERLCEAVRLRRERE